MSIHGYVGNVITANPTAPTSSVATGVWTTEQQLLAQAAGNWPFTIPPYQISRSLRFNSADSAYLNRTPASASNRRTFTLSGWVKRTTPNSLFEIFSGYTGLANGDLRTIARFTAGNLLSISSTQMQVAGDWALETTQVFRDSSAWYHIVLAVDTTQATSTNRVKMYVNGAQVTAFSYAVYPSLNYQNAINYNFNHYIGLGYDSANPDTFTNGYMTEFNFIDGQQLTPSSFGETNTSTGVWQAKAYSGSYGTNGFYLNFSDNSNTTAATLGKDYSGNGNNWTPNNFSVTAGAGNDSLVDSPASYSPGDTGVGGQVRGNYATLNPLRNDSTNTLANGNLDVTFTNASIAPTSFATVGLTSGKWYWEQTVTATDGASTYYPGFGVNTNLSLAPSAQSGDTASGFMYFKNGQKYNSGSLTSYGSSYTTNDVIGVALDMDAGTITFYKNGSSQGQAFSGITGTAVPCAVGAKGTNNTAASFNFGQRAFAYTAPSGFQALVTTNLPTPTIGATSTTLAGKYFNPVLYTGNGTSSRSITGVGFAPDFVWVKNRSGANSHGLYDTIRGATKSLYSNSTSDEQTDVNSLTAFGSDGFTVGTDGIVNTNTSSYVSWNWNAGGSTVTNTSGTISAQVRANTTSGFSIVTSGVSTSAFTVGHGLGVAPAMMISKTRNVADSWYVYHQSLAATESLRLNTTGAVTTGGFNGTRPTSTVLTLGGFGSSSYTNVVYCFAAVAGYSAFGSYTGNGSADGPFVYTGFRPEFIMTRSTSASREWYMYDAARDTYNVATNYLRANTSAAEGSFTSYDMVSNGFKLRSSDTAFNGSGETYIYMAFAEFPFKYALAR